jgi:hypothetical protein
MFEAIKRWFFTRPAETIRIESRSAGDQIIDLITRGLEAFERRNLQLARIPADLEGPARDLLLRFAELSRRIEPLRDGDPIGGPLMGEVQPAVQMASARIVTAGIEPGSEELVRLVDYGEPVNATPPIRLLSTHLALLGGETRHPHRRLELYQRSTELYPGSAAQDEGRVEFDRGENLNNYLGWEGLGEVLIELGKVEEGWKALSAAVVRCPAWARDFAGHVQQSVASAQPPQLADPRVRFWLEVQFPGDDSVN